MGKIFVNSYFRFKFNEERLFYYNNDKHWLFRINEFQSRKKYENLKIIFELNRKFGSSGLMKNERNMRSILKIEASPGY